MHPVAKAWSTRYTKTYQQTMSLECLLTMVNLKELVKKKKKAKLLKNKRNLSRDLFVVDLYYFYSSHKVHDYIRELTRHVTCQIRNI